MRGRAAGEIDLEHQVGLRTPRLVGNPEEDANELELPEEGGAKGHGGLGQGSERRVRPQARASGGLHQHDDKSESDAWAES